MGAAQGGGEGEQGNRVAPPSAEAEAEHCEQQRPAREQQGSPGICTRQREPTGDAQAESEAAREPSPKLVAPRIETGFQPFAPLSAPPAPYSRSPPSSAALPIPTSSPTILRPCPP